MPITVLNPTSMSEVQPLQLAPPIATLRGALIGVLDNGKVNSDWLFREAVALLQSKYGVREVVWRRKHDFSRPAPDGLLAELSPCDAILTGIGD